MEYLKRRWSFLEKIAVAGLIFIVMFVIGYYTGFLRENCKDNAECFNSRISKCRASEVLFAKNNNLYRYEIRSSVFGYCEMKVTLERVEAGAGQEFKDLQGKSMKCEIPKKLLNEVSLEKFDDMMKYCHGRLKEGIYEIIINRMYSFLVGQLGDVVKEIKKF